MTQAGSEGGAVAEGRNGRLFLARDGSYCLREFVAGRSLTCASLERWRLTVQRRAAELGRRGIPYVFYIVPDAPSVYPEDLPPGLVRGETPGQRLSAALQGIANVTVVYPLSDLLEAKGALPVYRETDTHWSGYGAFVAYGALCRAIDGLLPMRPLMSREVGFELRQEFGDLGSLATPERTGRNATIRIRDRSFTRDRHLPGPFRTNSQLFHADGAPPARVLILRDSFMTEQAPLMAVTFGSTEMVGTTSRLFLEHVDRTRPSMVMTEICERRLTEWENDHQLLGFDEMFGTDWTTDVGRLALATELALDRGQLPEIRRASDPLLDHAGELSPGHAFVAARACMALGDFAAADLLIARSLAAEPDRPAFLCIAAQLRFALGDGLGALAQARQAVRCAPWNGFTHELLAYLLLAVDQVTEAAAVLDAATDRIADHPHLFFLASLAAERDGRPTDAIAAMRRCIGLWPDNADYAGRLSHLLEVPALAGAD